MEHTEEEINCFSINTTSREEAEIIHQYAKDNWGGGLNRYDLMQYMIKGYDMCFENRLYVNGYNKGMKPNKYKSITFKDFIERTKDTLIGYKLKEEAEEFRKAAHKIAGVNSFIGDKINFLKDSKTKINLEDAGVLDKWFSPVYETIYKVGDYVLMGQNSQGYGATTSEIVGKVLKIREFRTVLGEERMFFEDRNFTSIRGRIARLATKEEIDALVPDVCGYVPQKAGDNLVFGCQSIPISTINGIIGLLRNEDFKFACSVNGNPISQYTLEKIAKNLNI